MRYYLREGSNQKFKIDLIETNVKNNLFTYLFEVEKTEDEKRDKQIYHLYVKKLMGKWFVSLDHIHWTQAPSLKNLKKISVEDKILEVFRGFLPSGLSAASSGELFTQMPGKVVSLLVNEGDRVKMGTPLVILEAMKMENEIKSSTEGVVKKIHVKAGDALEQNVLMMEIEDH